MENKIIIANWKMNGAFDEAREWVERFNQKIARVELLKKAFPKVVLCPPSIMIDYLDGLLMENEFKKIERLQKNSVEEMDELKLEKMVASLRKVWLGGQDCSAEIKGAFTGDVSAFMLKDAGCEFVIVGHSERRQNHSESDVLVAKKIERALENFLIPILCVGESKQIRDAGQYADFISVQLQNSLSKNLSIKKLIVAYEPVWSIGTGVVPTVGQIEEVAGLIRKIISGSKNVSELQVIYGGSVKKENAQEILLTKGVDGLLVGGASLDVQEFFGICGG